MLRTCTPHRWSSLTLSPQVNAPIYLNRSWKVPGLHSWRPFPAKISESRPARLKRRLLLGFTLLLTYLY